MGKPLAVQEALSGFSVDKVPPKIMFLLKIQQDDWLLRTVSPWGVGMWQIKSQNYLRLFLVALVAMYHLPPLNLA